MGGHRRFPRAERVSGRAGSFIAVGHADDALAGFALLAVFEGGEPGCFTVFASGGTDVFSGLGCCQCAAHRSASTHDDLAAGGAALAARHLIGA